MALPPAERHPRGQFILGEPPDELAGHTRRHGVILLQTESFKNIQTPSQADNPNDLNKNPGDTAHKANVKIVRDGDKVTQIVVVCNSGETIPLDCIY